MKNLKFLSFIFITWFMASCNSKPAEENSTTVITSAGIATSTFKVWGNCEMCKETVEKSLTLNGIEKSDWNIESKVMTVVYDTSKINLDKIEKAIASVGYDNEEYKGDDKAYSELPECCQYERKK